MRWFWYISLPKLRTLESQIPSLVPSWLSNIALSFELSFSVLKGNFSSTVAPSRRLVRRLAQLEDAIRNQHRVPRANEIDGSVPVFFSFDSMAGRFVQGAFHTKKWSEKQPGEDFYPNGAFVVAGLQGDAAVILIGNANNMFGSNRKALSISLFSQTPIVMLHAFAEASPSERNNWALSTEGSDFSAASAFSRCPPGCFAGARALAVFGASLPFTCDSHQRLTSAIVERLPDVNPQSVKRIIVGSPIYVEQVYAASASSHPGLINR